MDYIDIVLIGYIVNVFSVVFVVVTAIISMVVTLYKRGIFFDTKNMSQELRELKKSRTTKNKITKLSWAFLPFCGLIKIYDNFVLVYKSKFDMVASYEILIKKEKDIKC